MYGLREHNGISQFPQIPNPTLAGLFYFFNRALGDHCDFYLPADP